MSEGATREIVTSAGLLVPQQLLQSIFVAELLVPSRPLWLVSPWISDVELVDNRSRQFGSICPDWSASQIRLSTIFRTLLTRGGSITIVSTDAKENLAFMARMRELEAIFKPSLRMIRAPKLHEKGLIGEQFSLSGSMNLTFRGVFVNEEYLVYTSEPGRVSERRLTLESRWGTKP